MSIPPPPVLSDQALMEDLISRPDLLMQVDRALIVYGWAVEGERLDRWYQQETHTTKLFDYENMALYIREHISSKLSLVHDLSQPGQLYLALWYRDRDSQTMRRDEHLTVGWWVERKISQLSKTIDCHLQAAHHVVDEGNVYPLSPSDTQLEAGVNMLNEAEDMYNEYHSPLSMPAGPFQLPPWFPHTAGVNFTIDSPAPNVFQQPRGPYDGPPPPAGAFDWPTPDWVFSGTLGGGTMSASTSATAPSPPSTSRRHGAPGGTPSSGR